MSKKSLEQLKAEGVKLSERLTVETNELENFRSAIGGRVLGGENHDEIVSELSRREKELEVTRLSLEQVNELVTKAQQEQDKKDLEKRRRAGERTKKKESEKVAETFGLLVEFLDKLDEVEKLQTELNQYKLSRTFNFGMELRHIINFTVNRANMNPDLAKFTK